MKIRHLRQHEQLPIKHGLEPLPLDPQWAWVAENELGVVVGVLLLAPVHGAVFVARLVAGDNPPVTWVRRILTQASKDVLERGYRVAFAYFSMDRPTEARLAKLMMGHGDPTRHGAVVSSQAMCVWSVEDWI